MPAVNGGGDVFGGARVDDVGALMDFLGLRVRRIPPGIALDILHGVTLFAFDAAGHDHEAHHLPPRLLHALYLMVGATMHWCRDNGTRGSRLEVRGPHLPIMWRFGIVHQYVESEMIEDVIFSITIGRTNTESRAYW